MTFTERVKAIRKHYNLTQSEIGEALGMNRSSFANFEYDRIKNENEKKPTIIAICALYGVSEKWLLTGEGEMFAPRSRAEEIAEISARLFNDNDPERLKLFEFIAGMNAEELKAFKTLKEYAVSYLENNK